MGRIKAVGVSPNFLVIPRKVCRVWNGASTNTSQAKAQHESFKDAIAGLSDAKQLIHIISFNPHRDARS